MTPRVAIIGRGKMGRAVAQLAAERGWTVSTELGRHEGGHNLAREALGDAEVAIEFTEPAAAPDNIRACVRLGVPIVVGTTGWLDHLDEITSFVNEHEGAMLWAPNFSVGVALFTALVVRALRLFRRAPSFDAVIVETHHAAKKDAPSGTALALAGLAEEELGRRVGISSVRVGFVPGIHQLIFDGPFEHVQLMHAARDRRVFADGALLAAEWLRGKRGVFTMKDVLNLHDEDTT